MTKNIKGNVSNDVATSTEKNAKELMNLNTIKNTKFSIEIYQSGEYLKKEKDGTIHTIKVERKQTSLVLDFEITEDLPKLSKLVGRVIDIISTNSKFDFFIKNKVFTSKLNLNFAIHFNNTEFSGSKFFEVKPNFFTSQANCRKFYSGLTLFLASINGLYSPFSFENNVDGFDVINGKKFLLRKDYEKIEANKYMSKQITELLK